MASVTSIAAPGPAAATTAAPTAGGIMDIGDPTKTADHDVSFSDVLSVLNPLQYIPVVGTIYRAITGDSAPEAAQVLVSTLIGGPFGLVASAASAVVEETTGKDIGQHALAMLFPQDDAPPAKSQNQRYAAAPASSTPAPATSVAAAGADSTPAQTSTPASPPAASAAPPASADAAAPPAQPAAVASTPAASTPANQPAATSLPHPAASAAAPGAAAMATGSVVGGAVRPAGAGYTLADYRNFAGNGMTPPPNGNVQRTALVPLQTTIPLPNDVSRTPVVAAVVHTPSNVAAPTAPTPSDQPQDTWISQAMMHGLDRYRDMMRQQEQQQSQPQPAAAATPQ